MGFLQRSLTARLVTCFLLLATLILGVIGSAAYAIGRQNIVNNVASHLESVAILKQQELGNWVEQLEQTITWLASNPERRDNIAVLAKGAAGDPEYFAAHESLVLEFRRMLDLGRFTPVFLMDSTSGEITVSSDTAQEGKFRETEPYFIQGKNGVYVSDIFHSLTLDQPTMVVSAPIKSSTGELLGVLAGHVNLEPLSEVMLERSGLGRTGETFLVNKSNLLITNTAFAPDGAFKKWIFGEGTMRALEGRSSVGLFTDYRGEPVIGAYKWLEDRELALIAKQDQAEAFASIAVLRNTIILVGVLVMVFTAGVGLLLARWISSPLAGLAAYTRRIGEGEYTAEMEIKGRDEVASVASDVKTMVGQLLQAQAEQVLILETTSDAMMWIDANFTIVQINAAMATLSGLDSERSVGQKCFEVLRGETCLTKECLLSKVLETKTATTAEVAIERQDGTKLVCIVTANPFFDEQGGIVGILEDFVDITERKKMEERLLVSERLATLGQFSGNISHELRNPLGVIDSSAYYLKAKLKDADVKVHEHLDRIKGSVGSSTAIIESLLNLTRMEEPELKELDPIAVIHDAIASAKMSASLNIIQNFPEQEVSVNGDHEQLRMAFKNIVKNADEAMAGNGTLTVTIGRTDDDQVEVSFADTGSGIAAEDLDKVFQPLFSRKAKGIGFGLSIAKMVVDKHGGKIEARSESGKGATFIIQLPPYTDKEKEI